MRNILVRESHWLGFITGMFILLFFTFSVGAEEAQNKTSGGMSRSIKPSQWQKVVERHLRDQGVSPAIHLTLRVLSPSEPILVPSGKIALQVIPSPVVDQTGRRVFRVQIHVDSRLVKTVNVMADVEAESSVVSPIRWIKAHEIIQPDDLVVAKRSLNFLQQDFVMDKHEAVGKMAALPLSPQQPIRRTHLSLPPVIHKGDRVILEVKRGGLLVQTVGVAKAAGELGKMIPVENQQSGREVVGRIAGAGIVEVPF